MALDHSSQGAEHSGCDLLPKKQLHDLTNDIFLVLSSSLYHSASIVVWAELAVFGWLPLELSPVQACC